MTEARKQWVVGFLFRNNAEVALVLKTHPDWQAGKLNGVGGKIEEGESRLAAMQREFLEEAGVMIKDWREYACLKVQNGDVYFFVALGDHPIQSMTEEQVSWYPLDKLKNLPILENLNWLIPLALDPASKFTTTDYSENQ
jgi:8-oxo-dGTP diphosphatase